VLACIATPLLHGAPIPDSEEDIKALYVYNFAKYSTLPEGRKDSFVIGVAGPNKDDMLTSMKEMLDGQKIRNQQVRVERYERQRAKEYQILFWTKDSPLEDIKRNLNNTGVLTIGDDIKDFSNVVMIQLTAGRKIEFIINTAVARAADITFDPRLLRMARTIVSKPVELTENNSVVP